jgi:hypothetical protein
MTFGFGSKLIKLMIVKTQNRICKRRISFGRTPMYFINIFSINKSFQILLISYFILYFFFYCSNLSRENINDPESESYKMPTYSINIQASAAVTSLKSNKKVHITYIFKRYNKNISNNISISDLIFEINNIGQVDTTSPIITISKDGTIIPISIGSVDIIAYVKYDRQRIKSNTLTFEVLEYSSGIIFNPSGLTIFEGESGKIITNLISIPKSEVILDLKKAQFELVSTNHVPCTPFEVELSPNKITFTENNYSDYHEIFITYPDNNCVHYTLFFKVTFPVLESNDPDYENLQPSHINLTIVETGDTLPMAIPLVPFESQQNYSADSHFINIYFNKSMHSESINETSFILEDYNENSVPGNVWYADNRAPASGGMAFFSFKNYLKANREYTVRLKTTIKDKSGNYLFGGEQIYNSNEYSYKFKTSQWHFPLISNCQQDGICLPSYEISPQNQAFYVVSDNDFAYVADGAAGLQILDISDPFNPIIAGSCPQDNNCMPFDALNWISAWYVEIKDSYAYIADAKGGLQIINISDPFNPIFVGSCLQDDNCMPDPGTGLGGWASSVTVSNSYAYVADMGAGLQIIDISDPFNPALIGSCPQDATCIPPPSGHAETLALGIKVLGKYAYLADGWAGLHILNIENPANPYPIGSCKQDGICLPSVDTYTSAYNVEVSGSHAFVADERGGFQIIDISEPSNPQPAGSIITGSSVYDIAIYNSDVYASDSGYGLLKIDVSNLENLKISGNYNTHGTAYGVSIFGDYAYVADGQYGIQIVDISGPYSMSLASTYQTPANSNRLVISEHKAFIAVVEKGIQILEISNPSNPQIIGICAHDNICLNNGAYTTDVAVSGNFAYVVSSGFHEIDISDPSNPIKVVRNSWVGSGRITLSHYYAYITTPGSSVSDGLKIFDILELREDSPPIGTCLQTGSCLPFPSDNDEIVCDAAIQHEYAYVAVSTSGLHIINVSDPTSPFPVGSCLHDDSCMPSNGYASNVAVYGNYAYVADTDAGLQIINISDPSNPISENSCQFDNICMPSGTSSIVKNVTLIGHYAFVAGGASGVHLIDIQDPSNPEFKTSYDTPGDTQDIVVSGSYIYVVDGSSGGLHVIFRGPYQ